MPSVCRFCHAGCAILVDLDEHDRPVRVRGDRDNPVYRGFTCEKGRQLPEQHAHPDRLLRTMRRLDDGTYAPVAVDDAVRDVAARLRAIVDEHGPRAVAVYTGTCASRNPAARPALHALMDVIGSPMRFDSNTIDQPGKAVAAAMHGTWGAPPHGFDDADVVLLIGVNPFVSLAGGLPNPDPVRRVREARARGLQLLVIDPRRTETAAAADLHLRPVPGEDIAIVAALLHVILREGWHDAAFVDAHVEGLDALRTALAPFTPEHAAARAGLDPDEIVECARRFAKDGRRGVVVSGTGPSLQGRGSTLLEYLVMVCNTVCGRYLRAGERVWNPGVLLPELAHKAQPVPPRQAYGYGERLRVRDLTDAACGLSTAALADEMLLEGPGRVRALLCLGGNPAAAWPDHDRTVEALRSLDLLVTFDIKMSATAQLAHYVVAPKLTLEIPGTTYVSEVMYHYAVGFGLPVPHAQYTPAVAAPPAGAEVVEEWRFLARVGVAMGTPLALAANAARPGQPPLRVDDDTALTLDDVLDHLYQNSRVPLAAVRAHERGHVYDDSPVFVDPPDADCIARLDVANADMLTELAEAREQWWPHDPAHPFRLVCRRVVGALNSSGLDLPRMRARPHNPACLHPDDLAALGLATGDLARVASPHGSVLAVVEADPTLRRGVVTMTHAYGDVLRGDTAVRDAGTNTSRLTVVDRDHDRITGMPRMSNLDVSIAPVLDPR